MQVHLRNYNSSHKHRYQQFVDEKINTGNIYDLNQRDDGVELKLDFLKMYTNLSTFSALKNPELTSLSHTELIQNHKKTYVPTNNKIITINLAWSRSHSEEAYCGTILTMT